MVQKPHDDACVSRPQFESSVVLDGTKTVRNINKQTTTFESSVVLDGTKTRT